MQLSKQQISNLKRKNAEVNSDDLRPPEINNRQTTRWTNEEMLLAVEGVRKYGKNFQVIIFKLILTQEEKENDKNECKIFLKCAENR